MRWHLNEDLFEMRALNMQPPKGTIFGAEGTANTKAPSWSFLDKFKECQVRVALELRQREREVRKQVGKVSRASADRAWQGVMRSLDFVLYVKNVKTQGRGC